MSINFSPPPKAWATVNDTHKRVQTDSERSLLSVLEKLGIKSAAGGPINLVIPKDGIYHVSVTVAGIQTVAIQRYKAGDVISGIASSVTACEL